MDRVMYAARVQVMLCSTKSMSGSFLVPEYKLGIWEMTSQFKDKRVLITGASPDFGRILAIRFAQQGAEVFLVARTMEKAQLTAAMVHNFVPEARLHCYGADMCFADQIAVLKSQLEKDTDHIDILINNAGYWLQGPFLSVKDEDIVQAISSTLTGSSLMTKSLLSLLARSHCPDIVNISSVSALPTTSEPAHEAYSAAKKAMATFASRIRDRMAGSGLRVMTIYPPKFINHTPTEQGEWEEHAQATEQRYVTDKDVYQAINFALLQDRVCCLSDIYMSNNA